MSKHATKYRTPKQVRADARLLAGEPSRVARAAVGDDQQTGDPAQNVGELWLYGVVGGWWRGFDAESVAEALRKMDVDQLFVRIHSPGGLASDGIAIANLLRNHRATITVVVDGLAASAASVIAVAGDRVVMCPGSQMMLHDASTGMWGNERDLRRAADWIAGQSQNYAGVYAYRGGGTADQWREVMLANDGDGTWYTAEAAVAAGLADEVGTRVANGSPPTAPDDDDLEDEDTWASVAHDLQLLDECVHPAARAAWSGERRAAPKPPNASAVGSTHTEGGSAVAFSNEQMTTLRSTLQLEETADEAAILAAVTAVVAENVEEHPARAGVPDGHVIIPQARVSDLEATAAQGAKAVEKLAEITKAEHEREREAFLDANKAKFAAQNRDAWAKEFDRDPEGTRAHFSAAPDFVPVAEVGHEIDAEEKGSSETLAAVRESETYQNWSM